MTVRDYDDVPGTYVLDSRSYRRGYHLNMMLMALNSEDSRTEFAAGEEVFLDKYRLTDEQRSAVLERRYLDMLKLGANVYYTFKLVSHDRLPPQIMYGKMANPPLSFEEFQEMMISGGRPIDGNRRKGESEGE